MADIRIPSYTKLKVSETIALHLFTFELFAGVIFGVVSEMVVSVLLGTNYIKKCKSQYTLLT